MNIQVSNTPALPFTQKLDIMPLKLSLLQHASHTLPEVGKNVSEKAETGCNVKNIFTYICGLYSLSLAISRLRTENPKIKASVKLPL